MPALRCTGMLPRGSPPVGSEDARRGPVYAYGLTGGPRLFPPRIFATSSSMCASRSLSVHSVNIKNWRKDSGSRKRDAPIPSKTMTRSISPNHPPERSVIVAFPESKMKTRSISPFRPQPVSETPFSSNVKSFPTAP